MRSITHVHFGRLQVSKNMCIVSTYRSVFRRGHGTWIHGDVSYFDYQFGVLLLELQNCVLLCIALEVEYMANSLEGAVRCALG